jgi:hypothetical protein
VESQARVALEVGTGCTVFVENTAGFTDHVVRARSCSALCIALVPTLARCFCCAGVEPLAEQRALPQLRVRRERRGWRARAAGNGASRHRMLLTQPHKRRADTRCPQAEEWVGKSTLFVRDLVLSTSLAAAVE